MSKRHCDAQEAEASSTSTQGPAERYIEISVVSAMEREFAALEEKLASASARMAAEYFQLPVADADSVYRERVYCYEFYHQLRCEWGDFDFSLGGEVDKIGHPHFQDGPYARSKPDLLVHQPGNMNHNLACIEVKPYTGDAREFRNDLLKLTWFCRHAGYYRGLFLVYGSEAGDKQDRDLLRANLRKASEGYEEINMARIVLWAHAAAGQQGGRINHV